jgi:hypothetical protein
VRIRWFLREIILVVVVGFLTATLIWGTVAYFRQVVSFGPLWLACMTALALLRQRALFRVPRDDPEPVPPLNVHRGQAASRFARIERIRERLQFGQIEARHVRIAVVPLLRRLAEDRLLRRHAVSLDTQPGAARDILGSDLFTLIDQPARRTTVATENELAAWVKRLEDV